MTTRRPVLLLVVQIVVVLAILGCALLLVARRPWRLDLTPERTFTLSPYTHEVLDKLQSPVDITVFYSGQEAVIRRDMATLLSLYADASADVRVRLLDLDRSPGAAERLGVSNYNTAVIEAQGLAGPRRERVDLVNEDHVTAALLKVAGVPTVVTYFVQGHGEHNPRDEDARMGAADAERVLGLDGFDVRTLEGVAKVPADAGLVVIAGATHDFLPAEVDALAAYVRAGGDLLVLTDPGTPPSVARLLAGFGIEVGGDLVVDEQARLFGTDGLAARVAYLNQTMVPRDQSAAALLPVAQSLRLVDSPGVKADYLAVTGETTWADVDRRALDGSEVAFRTGVDRRGPLPVGVFARVAAPEEREGRIVVLGDSDFLTNLHLGVLGNRDLLVTLAELAARSEVLSASRRATRSSQGTFSPLALTAREARVVFWTAVMGPSMVFALLGAYAARRRRAA